VVVSFLLLEVTASSESMNMSKAMRQLSRRLAFILHNSGVVDWAEACDRHKIYSETGLSWVALS